ncbi:MAG TPA: catalase [Erysipelotrichaceae bacterium]|nr:catalase [Erysipelotrichaceae bacterium]
MRRKLFYNAINHFKTITNHKLLVMKYCFKVGLYKQGLLHDLSKYFWVEFSAGIKYYKGNLSPNAIEKIEKGYSKSWLHHKGRNKHHWEYWYDFTKDGYGPIEMPIQYVCEMICDRIAASRIYLKDNYKNDSAYEYFITRLNNTPMHKNTELMTKTFLGYIKDYGEEEGLKMIKEELKKRM